MHQGALVCLLVARALAQPNKMHNIDYAAGGYNIFYGNPRPTKSGVDPGFTNQLIFEQRYSKGSVTGDGRYLVPDGYAVVSDSGCKLSFSSESTFKSSDYKTTLKASVHADFPIYGAAFEASSEWSRFQQLTSSGSTKLVTSMAECSLYVATVNRYSKPTYTENFNAALKTLPDSYGDGKAYFDFFDAFGTHALSGVKMGATFGFRSYFSEKNWSNVEATGVSIDVAAQYEGTVKAGGGLNSSFQTNAQQEFDQNMQHYDVVSLGTKPTKGDPIEWAQQAIEEPMPIEYHLLDICDVIDDSHLQGNCKTAAQKEEYCTKRIKVRGDVASCDGVADMACVWAEDCGPAQQCVNHFCATPSKTGHLKSINHYWNDHDSYNTFHASPAWTNEHEVGSNAFYAFDAQITGSIPINRYFHDEQWTIGTDNTFHPSPAWDGEHNAGDGIFYAFDKQVHGTVAINRYWDDNVHKSTFHPAPEWPNEHELGTDIFYAYQKPAACSAHGGCSDVNAGDCCPTAQGVWMQCCDQDIDLHNVTESATIIV